MLGCKSIGKRQWGRLATGLRLSTKTYAPRPSWQSSWLDSHRLLKKHQIGSVSHAHRFRCLLWKTKGFNSWGKCHHLLLLLPCVTHWAISFMTYGNLASSTT